MAKREAMAADPAPEMKTAGEGNKRAYLYWHLCTCRDQERYTDHTERI